MRSKEGECGTILVLRILFNLLRELFKFVFGFGGVFEGACEAEGLGKLDSGHVFGQVTEGFFDLSACGRDDGADFFAAEIVAAQEFADGWRIGSGPKRHNKDHLFLKWQFESYFLRFHEYHF